MSTNPPGVGGDISNCTPYQQRDQFSVADFVLCEQGFGWVGYHFILAMFFYVVYPIFPWPLLFVLVAENLEWVSFVLIGVALKIGGNLEDEGQLETFAGSYVGDVFIQGLSGLLAGYIYHRLWESPPLMPWNLKSASLYMKLGTSLLAVFYLFMGTLHFLVTSRLNLGVAIFIPVNLIFYGVFLAFTSTKRWERIVWNPQQFHWRKRVRFFFYLWLIQTVIGVQNLGWLYVANNQWIQSWAWQAFLLMFLTLTLLFFGSVKIAKTGPSLLTRTESTGTRPLVQVKKVRKGSHKPLKIDTDLMTILPLLSSPDKSKKKVAAGKRRRKKI